MPNYSQTESNSCSFKCPGCQPCLFSPLLFSGTFCWEPPCPLGMTSSAGNDAPSVCTEHHCHFQLKGSPHPKWVVSWLTQERMMLFLTRALLGTDNIDCPPGSITIPDLKPFQPAASPSWGSSTVCGVGQETQFLRESCTLPPTFSSQAPKFSCECLYKWLPRASPCSCQAFLNYDSRHSMDPKPQPPLRLFLPRKKKCKTKVIFQVYILSVDKKYFPGLFILELAMSYWYHHDVIRAL